MVAPDSSKSKDTILVGISVGTQWGPIGSPLGPHELELCEGIIKEESGDPMGPHMGPHELSYAKELSKKRVGTQWVPTYPQ